MLDELVAAKKITIEQASVYQLFWLLESGRNYLNEMMKKTFMDTPVQPTNEVFAFLDGRRSVFREIIATIDYVNKTLEETHV